MAKTLDEAAGKPMVAADVIRSGEKMILPEGMTLRNAIKVIESRIVYEEEDVAVSSDFNVFPWDGAVAFDNVLQRRYGWAPAVAIKTMFGPKPPELVSVEIAPGVRKQVPWGEFELPNITGKIRCGVTTKRGMTCFALNAKVKRKDEDTVRKLFDEVRVETDTNSIYRGKAIKIKFFDSDGDLLTMPEPEFIDTDKIDTTALIYSRDVEQSVRTNLFVPITRARDCLKNGIPVKRGVLLGGTYGTGKTMAATVASKLACEAGITYVYVPTSKELPSALIFARQYQSPACVVFCEDIDRSTSGQRTEEMDEVLNVIDGIDSKTANIIVVLTTNDLEAINPAMLRPGRLDAVIEVTPPDAEAVTRLIRYYGGTAIAKDTKLESVGPVLQGQIPAIIAEVVKRAKIAQLGIQPEGTLVKELSEQALLDAAKTMQAQISILSRAIEAGKPAPIPALDQALVGAIQRAGGKDHERMERLAKHVGQIHDRVVN